jgi:hypothetical protein
MPNSTKARPWLFAGGVALLGIALLSGLHLLADNYLRSDAFRKLLDQRASNSLNADAHFSALTGDCSDLRAGKFEAAANGRGCAFAHLAAEDIRASPSLLQSLLHRTWSIDHVEAEALSAELGAEPATPPGERAESQTMDVRSIEIHRLNLGIIQGMHLTMKRSGTLWAFTGAGGSAVRVGFPPLSAEKLEGQASADDVLVPSAILHGASGVISLKGDVQLIGDRTVALDGTVNSLPLEFILPEDWRAQISGPVSGTFDMSGSLNDLGGLQTSGHLTMEQGMIEALPILRKLAPFLGSLDQFREVNIGSGSADFTATSSEISIRNLQLESPGICRMQGSLTISPSGALSGNFELGIAGAIFQQVFTEDRDGYHWTRVHVSGTTRYPAEDLSPRISAAAASELKAKGNTALKSAADFLGNLINN